MDNSYNPSVACRRYLGFVLTFFVGLGVGVASVFVVEHFTLSEGERTELNETVAGLDNVLPCENEDSVSIERFPAAYVEGRQISNPFLILRNNGKEPIYYLVDFENHMIDGEIETDFGKLRFTNYKPVTPREYELSPSSIDLLPLQSLPDNVSMSVMIKYRRGETRYERTLIANFSSDALEPTGCR